MPLGSVEMLLGIRHLLAAFEEGFLIVLFAGVIRLDLGGPIVHPDGGAKFDAEIGQIDLHAAKVNVLDQRSK